jgi:DNA-binding protein H-NS
VETATWSSAKPGGMHVHDGRIPLVETMTDKQRAIDALRALPEHATIADAIERLCFIAKIEEGLRQSEEGQLVSHDEVKKQFLL